MQSHPLKRAKQTQRTRREDNSNNKKENKKQRGNDRMDRSQIPSLSHKSKSGSFSLSLRSGNKSRDSGRSLSLRSVNLDAIPDYDKDKPSLQQIEEEEEEGGGGGDEEEQGKQEEEHAPEQQEYDDEVGSPENIVPDDRHSDLPTISEAIDEFLATIQSLRDGDDGSPDAPQIAQTLIQRFAPLLEKEIFKFESLAPKWSCFTESPRPLPPMILDAIDHASKLYSALATFSPYPKFGKAINLAGGVVHHAMTFLEDEFYSLLEDSRTKVEILSPVPKSRRPPSFNRSTESDRCLLRQATEPNKAEPTPPYPKETVERLRRMATEMFEAGYDVECVHVFTIARCNSLESGLQSGGFEKVSFDDVQWMKWESLETLIAAWIKAFRHAFAVALPDERELCESVFSVRNDVARAVLWDVTRCVLMRFIDFAEAVALTKRSAEKLFKVLDMYEALQDAAPRVSALFAGEEEQALLPFDLKSEIVSASSRLGGAAVATFCELESSIKADSGKTPVPGGAIHPLTRYLMNYLKYACEYNTTLEHVFQEHEKSRQPSSSTHQDSNGGEALQDDNHEANNSDEHSPFALQLMQLMDLLHLNLDTKSRLYKDSALSNIFLMNNGRYIMQKLKGSQEINKLLGDGWCRRRSSELRQYHKNYQRETWARVLACFRDEGLQSNGRVVKPVLKERFKSFNSLFEDIHKSQSTWVVSDEQLQSELRVSVSAVVVPAYRSFLGRFQQYFTPGRQAEKYVKYAPDDLEKYIDELFDGTPSSMARRRT